MGFISTRGRAATLDFPETVLAGLAGDGGLYVPQAWPRLSPEAVADLSGAPFETVAETAIGAFAGGDPSPEVLSRLIGEAMGTFRHAARAPLVQIGPDLFLLELFHGPTLAFKDVAMQFLARLIDHLLRREGRRATVIAATSGDTGAAAADAFRGRAAVDMVILFPHGRVSQVQRRQMTTLPDDNVHALAVDGTFDDCQRIVKALFADAAFRTDVGMTGVNSINLARIVAQTTYYFTAALALGAPHRPVAFSVPTGNFGDILAGDVARRMGLPLGPLVIATNENDILARTLETGTYRVGSVRPTSSPSMDIQVASNFERLLFELLGRDADAVRAMMDDLSRDGAFTLPAPALATLRQDFAAARVDEDETRATIRDVHGETGEVIDPHTAVGVAAARRAGIARDIPKVVLATAHPAKFPDAVEAACGVRPALPEPMADLLDREERITRLPADTAAVAAFVRANSRACARESAGATA